MRSRFRRRKPGLLRWMLAFLIVFVAVAAVFVTTQLRSQLGQNRAIKVLVRSGQTLGEIGDTLATRGVIRSPAVFTVVARLLDHKGVLSAGRYTFPLAISEYRAYRILEQGGEKSAFVTIPEGFTVAQIAARLDAAEVCGESAFLAACRDSALLRELNLVEPSVEGYLFPDSYYLPFGIAPAEIIRLMNRRFAAVYREVSAGSTSRLSTPAAVTLASIVEAEVARDSERPVAASVFLNRLMKGMRLQSCATVEYLLPQRKAILSDMDTKTESPYNTYLHAGLPPGPICNPGRASLRATLFPARSDYLFFVSRGDGGHCFTTTFADHLAAQRRYRQDR